MYVPQKYIARCLAKAIEIGDQYRLQNLASDNPLRSVEGLRRTCESHLNVRIELLELNVAHADSVVLGACIVKADGSFDVCTVSGLNDSWCRFVRCKELFHVLLDRAEDRDMDIAGHVEALTLAFGDDESHPTAARISELTAEVAAMEFLFPMVMREAELLRPSPDYPGIAERLQIPQVYVERYMAATAMTNLRGAFAML